MICQIGPFGSTNLTKSDVPFFQRNVRYRGRLKGTCRDRFHSVGSLLNCPQVVIPVTGVGFILERFSQTPITICDVGGPA